MDLPLDGPPVTDPRVTCLSAATDGSVWAVDTEGRLLANTEHVVPWQTRPGTLVDVGAASDGSVYGVNAAGTLFVYRGSWLPLDGPPAGRPAAVAVGGATAVWVLTGSGDLYTYQPETTRWSPVGGPDGKPASQVSVTSDGTVVAVGTTGTLYRYDGPSWSPVPTPEAVARIGAGAAGYLWMLGASGALARYDGEGRAWVPVPPPPDDAVVDLACGDDLTAAAVTRSGRLYLSDLRTDGWIATSPPVRLARVSAGSRSCLWAVGTAGEVVQYTEHTSSWSVAGLELRLGQVSARDAATIWAVDAAGQVYECTSDAGRWRAAPRPDGPVWVSAPPDGSVWGVGADGTLLRYDDSRSDWKRLGAPPSSAGRAVRVSAGGPESVTVLCDSGVLYRYGGAAGWDRLPETGSAGVRSPSVLTGGGVYAVDTAGALHLYLPPWVPVGDQLSEVSAGSVDDVWAIDPGGRPLRLEHPVREATGPGPGLPGWDSEAVFDETRSTHLWIVNRAAQLAGTVPDLGSRLLALVTPGLGRTGVAFHDRLCQGLYDADWLPAYNNPSIFGIATYKSHFYDVSSGLNWRGDDDPTALTEGAKHFEASVRAYLAGDLATAGYELGLSLHYLTDLTQPMHATNFTWLDSHPVLGYHTDYEGYVMEIQATVYPQTTYRPSTLGDDPRAYLISAATRSRRFENTLAPEQVHFRYTHYTSALREIARSTATDILRQSIEITSQYLVAWIRQVVRPWSDRGLPPLVGRVQYVVGATAYGDRPYVFTKAGDNRMWVSWYDGRKWAWANHGGTGSTPIGAPVGAASNARGPAAFVIGGNGHVLADWWTGAKWQWSDLGAPPGTGVAGAVGVAALEPATAFVWGNDGGLYRVGVGPNSTGWHAHGPALGGPVTGGVGVTIRGDGRCVAVVLDATGRLTAFVGGSPWSRHDLGTPPAPATRGLGATAAGGGVCCFVLGTDEQVWAGWWNGASTSWTAMGNPPDDMVSSAIGAVTAQETPYVAVRGGQGAVWVGWPDGGTPRWVGKGMPVQGGVRGAMTLVAGGRPMICAVGADWHLWTQTRPVAPGWQPWTQVNPGSRPADGPVTAVWRDAEHLDLFTTGSEGTVRTNFWERDTPWPGWTPLDGPRLAPGARVAAVWRAPLHLDLFGGTADGTVYSTFWDPSTGWRAGWFPISPATRLDGGAPITAVWRDASHLDLFGVAADGTVRTTFWEQTTGWRPWAGMAGGPPTLPGVTVAAVWRAPQHLDLFTTGYDGSVLTAYWEPSTGWQPWRVVPTPNPRHMGRGASVTAVWRDDRHLDLFVSGTRTTGPQGTVWSTYFEFATGWAAWFPIHPEQELSVTGTVAAEWTPGRGRLDLFTTGPRPTSPDGGVWTTSWRPSTGWVPWRSVAPDLKVAAPNASVAAGWWRTDRLFIEVNGPDGGVYRTYWEPPV